MNVCDLARGVSLSALLLLGGCLEHRETNTTPANIPAGIYSAVEGLANRHTVAEFRQHQGGKGSIPDGDWGDLWQVDPSANARALKVKFYRAPGPTNKVLNALGADMAAVEDAARSGDIGYQGGYLRPGQLGPLEFVVPILPESRMNGDDTIYLFVYANGVSSTSPPAGAPLDYAFEVEEVL